MIHYGSFIKNFYIVPWPIVAQFLKIENKNRAFIQFSHISS
jgi:hypothetical protein